MDDIGIRVRQILNQFGEFTDRNRFASPDIARLAGVLCCRCGLVRVDDILNKDEITGL
ncbi:hypothetical protein SAMN05216226_107191 [Halovenus aranensis]|uniref:Uncharacterized protein n=1 Tax=Halovenus aranensis TaxID=890420 RepID=A0A1G8VW60_9EURY|nr:hypothetical protein SAMN05216226_107191 [Halovenus aranensis]